ARTARGPGPRQRDQPVAGRTPEGAPATVQATPDERRRTVADALARARARRAAVRDRDADRDA
ncbi:MAG: hypothetical protein ACREYB_13010, partial [Casimicrobiaceae bacterium]